MKRASLRKLDSLLKILLGLSNRNANRNAYCGGDCLYEYM